jgi:hypothetical protein
MGTATDIVLVRDNDLDVTFTVKNADGTATDLTGCAVLLYAKNNPWDSNAEAVIKKGTDATGGITITDAHSGSFRVRFFPSDTSELSSSGLLHYDVLIIDQFSKKRSIAVDSVIDVRLNVTR